MLIATEQRIRNGRDLSKLEKLSSKMLIAPNF